MKTTKFFCIMVTAIVMFSQTRSIAQEEKGFEKKKENIEAQKAAYITSQLGLTTEESQIFWPVYNEYAAKKEAITKDFRKSNKLISPDSLSEAKAKERITAELKMQQDILDLRKEYFAKFLKVLPAVKVVKLQKAEADFKKVLLKMLKDAPKKPQK
jgi:hypothetical protein